MAISAIDMYYPIQIPYILSREFSQNVQYAEETIPQLSGFVICFWEMRPRSARKTSIENIIIADGCIDLVASLDERQVGFVGMRNTDFHFKVDLPAHFMGARLKPGAFFQLTGLPATAAMDCFVPVEAACAGFDRDRFFSLPFEQAKAYFISFFQTLTCGRAPSRFTSLFDELSLGVVPTAAELYQLLHFTPRQCQRLFLKHYGLPPKVVQSIVRFHKCLAVLTANGATLGDGLSSAGYYDQAHFIKDFKKNIGITPRELIRIYQN
jgi:AraC-like DNA-binding protein